MFSTRQAVTADRPFETVVAQLQQRPDVHGLLAIGSTGSGDRNESSDIDLVIVVEPGRGVPRLALSVIDGGVADVLFVTGDEVKRWPDPGGAPSWPVETLGRWLRTGRILFDRSGLLADARGRALGTHGRPSADVTGRYSTWFSINYNLVQNRRMARSADPIYAMALELRLLYSLSDLWQAYFALRDLPQRGEKEQIRYLQEADPDYLQLFQHTLTTADLQTRLALSADLAERCLEPAGGVWPAESACVLPWSDPPSDDDVNAAWAGWEALFGA